MKLRLPFHNTLTSRLFVMFVLFVALPVAASMTLLVLVAERELVRNAADQMRETIEQIARSMDEEARQIALWAAALSSDEQILGAAEAFAAGGSESQRTVAAQALDRKMASFFDYTNKIGSVQIFFRGRSPYLYRNSPFLFELPVDRRGWYDEAAMRPARVRYIQDLRSYSLGPGERPLLSVAVAPGAGALGPRVALFLVSVRVAAMDAFNDATVNGRELVLINSDGDPILSSIDGVISPGRVPSPQTRLLLSALSGLEGARGAGGATGITGASGRSGTSAVGVAELSSPVVIDGKPYLVSDVPVPSPGWRLVSAIPNASITRSVALFSRLAWYSLFALFALFIAYMELSFRELIRPLRLVVDRMREVERGDYSVTVGVRGPEEILRLGSAFNSMVSEVKRLTAEREANQRERSRLELEALRLQINPHFLSNTLNAIRLMAIMMKARNIQAMTTALMKVVNESFGREGALSELRTEIRMLRSYVLIMKFRYGSTFTVAYAVDPDAQRLPILRMLLQPIVENSILHGFQELPRKGRIDLRAHRDGNALHIVITDNGVGSSRERLCAALEEHELDGLGVSHVGLANVARRIKLNHGPEYGLSIETAAGAGTTVTLRLPILSPERADVPRDGR